MPTAPSPALSRLPAPPPVGGLQFFDGYFPVLAAGSYQIWIKHVVNGEGTTPTYFWPASDLKQGFVVQAPEFVIDQGIVQSVYPPDGSSDNYHQLLPFVVLSDPSLPWERSAVPQAGMPDPASPSSWMALLIFAEGEIQLQPSSNNPVSTCTVAQLVASDPHGNVLKPQFPSDWLSEATLASQCQTITVTGAAFNAVAPGTDDLPFLAHCRAVRSAEEGEALVSVLLCNRLAVADTRQTTPAPLRWFAHLVSLEGYAAYLGPNAKPIPEKANGKGLMDVQLVSLTSWTFISLPETGTGFRQLVQGLIESERTTPVLSLPSVSSGINPVVVSRLQDGYAPLKFVVGTGESSFAWYRGPFTPVDPQPLPAVGDPPVDPRHATTADALMIYLAEEGLFDLSYSAAWNIGRELALADSQFAQTINRYRQVSRAALGRLSQRLMMPHFSGHATLAQLAAPKATRAHFSARIGDGLGYAWTRALASIREGARPASPAHYRTAPVRRRPAIAPREVLAMAGAAEAVTENVGQELDAIAAWLANLSLLRPVPFSHLVPDSRMLPTESIRFFYVDQGWIDAAVAGALSLAVHGSADLALLSAVRPHLDHMVGTHRVRLSGGAVALSSAGGAGVTGLLIRSLLVSGWPDLVVTPTLGGAPLPVIRDDCPSPAVRLSLFQGVPDTVRLSEPYQSLRFGVEDGRIYPRCVTLPAAVGAQITNATPVNVAEALRTPATGAVGGVLHVGALAAKLQTAADVLPFAAGAVVQWNGTNLQTTFVSDRQLTAAVPAGLVASAGTAAVTAVTGGATSAPVTFTIDAALAVDSLTPSWIGAGTGAFTLTVRGQGFGTDAVVHCNGTALTTRVVSMMEVTASVPSSAVATPGTATITVTSGTATSNPATLTVVGAYPGIDSLEPNLRPAGADGFTLTVLGSGFAPDSQVQWNGSALTTRIEVAGRQLAAAVPARLIATKGTASVTVAAGGLPSQPAAFTIAGPNPTLGGLRPAVALAGGAVVTLIVDGVNFASGATVNWNGTPLTTTFDDSEQVTATVPASLLAVAGSPHAITVVSGGMTSNALPFAVIAPQPAIGLLEPNTVVAGAAAFTLTVTAGFGSGDYALQMVRAPESQAFIPIT